MPQSRSAITGLGITEPDKVYGKTAAQFAAEAVRLAVADAGLALGDLDGLLVSGGLGGSVSIELRGSLGLANLRLLTSCRVTAPPQARWCSTLRWPSSPAWPTESRSSGR
jgi:hypothetical protein